jgi:hypothetical protein
MESTIVEYSKITKEDYREQAEVVAVAVAVAVAQADFLRRLLLPLEIPLLNQRFLRLQSQSFPRIPRQKNLLPVRSLPQR